MPTLPACMFLHLYRYEYVVCWCHLVFMQAAQCAGNGNLAIRNRPPGFTSIAQRRAPGPEGKEQPAAIPHSAVWFDHVSLQDSECKPCLGSDWYGKSGFFFGRQQASPTSPPKKNPTQPAYSGSLAQGRGLRCNYLGRPYPECRSLFQLLMTTRHTGCATWLQSWDRPQRNSHVENDVNICLFDGLVTLRLGGLRVWSV